MYTEDDDKVKVKNKNSNDDYNDFYTAFNESNKSDDNKDNKSTKNTKDTKDVKKKVVPQEDKVTPKDEDDYSDFYGTDDEDVEEPVALNNSYQDDNSNKKQMIIKIGLILVFLIVIGVILWLLLGSSKGDIEINDSEFTLKPGDIQYISYRIIDTDQEVTTTFESSDSNVVTVDTNGVVTAVGNGEATITVRYTIGTRTKEKKCSVKVSGPEAKHELTLNLKSSANGWTNKDVTITVDAKTDSSITSLKYAINCTSNCTYKDVVNNKIVINSTGVTKVTVIAKDKNNKEVTKNVEVKIDKEAPTVTYTGSENLTSNNDIEVCVDCSDTISGCKQNRVCKKFATTAKNQTVTVYDNAGNSKSSQPFNITINRDKVTCSLKVSSDGTVSATLGSSAEYYGFNSSYSGNNELSKKVDITVKKKGSAAKVVHYYVKSKSGKVGTCYITVIKECKCANNTSGDNCPLTCTFRAS